MARGTNRRQIALSDWFNPPVIHKMEWKDGRIRIWASDNVMVASVQVLILDEEGKVVKQGEGVRREGDWWEFVPSARGKVAAEAIDLAGNVVKEEMAMWNG